MIDYLYNMHCVVTWTNDKKLDEILSLSPDDEVALTVLVHDGGARLVRITVYDFYPNTLSTQYVRSHLFRHERSHAPNARQYVHQNDLMPPIPKPRKPV